MDYSEYFEKSLKETKQKLKDAVRNDWLIIQAIDNIGELNRAANLLVKRLREWYELYNPEFSRSVADHEKFIELVINKSKRELMQEIGVKE